MKKKSVTIFTSIIFILFLMAVGFFSYNIYIEYSNGENRTSQIFNSAIAKLKNNDTREVTNFIQQNIENFSSVYISKNNETVYSYPNDNAKSATDTSLIQVFKTTIVQNGTIYNITSGLYIIRPSIIYKNALIAFIVIAISTLITLLVIIFSAKENEESPQTEIQNLPQQESKIIDDKNNSYEEQTEFSSQQQELYESEQENEENTTPEQKNEENIDIKSEDSENTEKNEENNNIKSEDSENVEKNEKNNSIKSEDSENVEKNEENNSIKSEETQQTQLETQNIFSPETGICYEKELIPHLESEISKAVSSEQELSLLLVKIENLTFKNELSSKIIDILLSEIQFRDKIFEYEQDSFALIKQDANIDKAEDFAETLNQKIQKIIVNTEYKCYIGLSSRTTRILSAERLINEAKEALKHAQESNDANIIGFHVDIEKYRQYLQNE